MAERSTQKHQRERVTWGRKNFKPPNEVDLEFLRIYGSLDYYNTTSFASTVKRPLHPLLTTRVIEDLHFRKSIRELELLPFLTSIQYHESCVHFLLYASVLSSVQLYTSETLLVFGSSSLPARHCWHRSLLSAVGRCSSVIVQSNVMCATHNYTYVKAVMVLLFLADRLIATRASHGVPRWRRAICSESSTAP